jgi:hypothetical protein
MPNINIFHDTFRWTTFDKDIIELKNGELLEVSNPKTHNYFLVAFIQNYQNEKTTFGVIHLPSKTLLSLWETEYMAQVFADTVGKMKMDWSEPEIKFNTPFEQSLFYSFPEIITQSLKNKIIPIDEDIVYTGTKYFH